MNKRFSCFTLLVIIIFSMSCGTTDKKNKPDHSAPYEKRQSSTRGKAVIAEVAYSKEDPAGENSGFMNIYFNFIPSDPGTGEKYLCSSYSDKNIKLFYDNRDSFHKTWVFKWEIKPGKEYPAIRHEFTRKNNTCAVSWEVFLEPGK